MLSKTIYRVEEGCVLREGGVLNSLSHSQRHQLITGVCEHCVYGGGAQQGCWDLHVEKKRMKVKFSRRAVALSPRCSVKHLY